MISRLTPALALVALMVSSGCTIRTGEAANEPHHHHKSPPPAPPPPKKKAEPKAEAKAPPKAEPEYKEAAPEKWEKLGEATANGKSDHDVVEIGRREGTFRALRFKVKNSNVKMQNVVVHFADGENWSPTTRVEFSEGSTSNIIDLPGKRRVIKSVNFRYSDGKGSGNGIVEVWGI